MSRRGEQIYKRKDGRWEARYVKQIGPDGRKKYGSLYAGSYRDAKEKQRLLCSCGGKPAAEPARGVSIAELAENWLRYKKPSVKQSSYQKYELLIRRHILPYLGKCPLCSVTRETVSAFTENCLGARTGTGAPLSVKTVNDILIVLGLMFRFAEEEYDVKSPRISFLKEEKKEARVLSAAEQAVLTAFLIREMDITKFGILLALYTGLRIGELCALQWPDISSEAISVGKTVQRLQNGNGGGGGGLRVGAPKSNASRRLVPLPLYLLPYVDRFRKPDGYVLYTSRRPKSEPRTLQFQFKRIAAQCGLSDVTFHTLRHTFATRCIEAGFDVKSLSEILGHADVKTTLNRYVHSSFALKQKNMAKLPLLHAQEKDCG